MEKYLQNLVITLPALAIAMGGLLLMVFMCLRSWSKVSSNLPILQRSATTQVDGSLQMSHEIRDKLVEEAMARVKIILAEEFRKKQATKISQEEFNNMYRKQRGLDSGISSTDIIGSDEKQKRQEFINSCRIPGVAPLTSIIPATQDPASLKKTDSFATLWVEELQRSGDDDAINSVPSTGKESTEPHQSIVPCSGSSHGTEPDSAAHDCILTQLGFGEATEVNEMKSPNELRFIHELQMFLLTASSNLCRSIMAFSMAHNSGKEAMTLSMSNKEICLVPNHDLEMGSNNYALANSVASTSTNMSAPQLLKGGAPQEHDDFVWRLDIEEKDVEPSPPNTPVRHRPPSHLCRGVQFQFDKHPPALSLINLDPEQGYGWRGPDWKETFGKYNVYKEHAGPSIYRQQKVKLASDPCVTEYYRSLEEEAKRRWENIQKRYRRAKEVAALKLSIQAEIRESAAWRKHLRETVYSESSSMSTSDREIEQREMQQQHDDRIKSMLTSSSSSPDSDDSEIVRRPNIVVNSQCKSKHRHCNLKTPKNSRRN